MKKELYVHTLWYEPYTEDGINKMELQLVPFCIRNYDNLLDYFRVSGGNEKTFQHQFEDFIDQCCGEDFTVVIGFIKDRLSTLNDSPLHGEALMLQQVLEFENSLAEMAMELPGSWARPIEEQMHNW
jgi:thiaminase